MPDVKSEREMQTKPLTPTPSPPLATLHIIAHLRWERESYETLETRRAQLLDTISRLHAWMSVGDESDRVPMRSFLLGGQTVILEDLAAIRPDLVTLLVIYNAGGRLGVGPWYILVDETLVNGESLIRNLLAARHNAEQYGLKLISVAYAPLSSSHPAQLPQILRSFGVDAAFLRHSARVVHLPFRWEAPDGTSILVVNDEMGIPWPDDTVDTSVIASDVQAQRKVRPDGPYMWMFNAGRAQGRLNDLLTSASQQTNLPLQQSDLREYVNALRHELADSMRPAIGGELRLQAMREHAYLHPGMLSSRLYLKQMHAEAQAYLLQGVEPWLSVALGQLPYPENNRALLKRAWKMLLHNQAHNALGGTSSDAVHTENELRYRKMHDIMRQLVDAALSVLPGQRHQDGQHPDKTQTHVMAYNPLNWPVKRMVEITLDLPEGRYPAAVRAAGSTEDQLFGWHDGRLIFLADIPALGYAAYTVQLSETPPDPVKHGTRRVSGRVIAKTTGETLSVIDGKIQWKRDAHVIDDVLAFIDSGDAGDTYNYSPPSPDTVVRADLIDNVEIESTPLFERLVINHRMRIAPELDDKRGRKRGLRLMEMQTTVTLYEHQHGIYVKTQFENTAKDHRLRAHLRTGIQSEFVTVDTPFALLDRPTSKEGPEIPPKNRRNVEGVINTQPMQNFAAVRSGTQSLALMSKGLPEYEAIVEGDQVTFALTLVRAVGWLSRDDLRTRPAQVAPMMPVPDAQCLRPTTAEYALVNTIPGDRMALLRRSAEYNAPLQAYQYDALPEDRTRRSFLSVVSDQSIGADSDGDGVILTALKPPEKSDGWVIRMFNPLEKPVEVYLTPYQRPDKAYLVTMTEAFEGVIEPDANGRVGVVANPHEIVSVMLTFSAE